MVEQPGEGEFHFRLYIVRDEASSQGRCDSIELVGPLENVEWLSCRLATQLDRLTLFAGDSPLGGPASVNLYDWRAVGQLKYFQNSDNLRRLNPAGAGPLFQALYPGHSSRSVRRARQHATHPLNPPASVGMSSGLKP